METVALENIRSVTYEECAKYFQLKTGSRADSLACNVIAAGGEILVYFKNKQPLGVLFAEPLGAKYHIRYIFIRKYARRRGIGQRLLAHFVEKHHSARVSICIEEDARDNSIVSSLVQKAGFVQESGCIMYGIRQPDSLHKKRVWLENKGRKIAELLRSRGYVAYSLSAVPENYLKQLLDAENSEYNAGYNARQFFDNTDSGLDYELSFLSVRNDALAAYCLVTRSMENRCVFEQITSAESLRGTGCFMLPFICASEVFAEKGYTSVDFFIYENNVLASSFQKKILADVVDCCIRYHCYSWIGDRQGYE